MSSYTRSNVVECKPLGDDSSNQLHDFLDVAS